MYGQSAASVVWLVQSQLVRFFLSDSRPSPETVKQLGKPPLAGLSQKAACRTVYGFRCAQAENTGSPEDSAEGETSVRMCPRRGQRCNQYYCKSCRGFLAPPRSAHDPRLFCRPPERKGRITHSCGSTVYNAARGTVLTHSC